MKIVNVCFGLIGMCLALSAQGANVDEILKQARANLGSEQVLDAVKSIQYVGKVYDNEGSELGVIELFFEKPSHQRLVYEQNGEKEITAVNEYEGFLQKVDNTGKTVNLVVLQYFQVKQLHLNAHENLSFFHGPNGKSGGEIKLLETTTFDGKKAHLLGFAYGEDLSYKRYFEVGTGKLLGTIAGKDGNILKENGSMVVDGIKFPKEVVTYSNGEVVRRVAFEKIVVNGELDESLFAFPESF